MEQQFQFIGFALEQAENIIQEGIKQIQSLQKYGQNRP